MTRQVFICLFLLGVSRLGMGQVVISEIASSNENIIEDVFGKTSDWIELYNAGNEPVNPESYHLSDHPGYLTMWSFPEIMIPAKGYLLVFCSGQNIIVPGELHTNFKLSQSGEYVFLSDPGGNVISWVEFGYIPTDQSYALYDDQITEFLICSEPTPGIDNELSTGLFYSHPSGYYDEEFQLELYSPGVESSIYYTRNGDTPRINQALYSTPVEIADVSESPYNISSIPTTPLEGSFHFEPWYWVEPQSVYMANVFRAGVYRNDTLASKGVSLTYFVDPGMKNRYSYPVVSIITDSLNLFDDETGIYVPGSIYGSEPLSYWPVGNFSQNGPEWEREMHISFFEPDGKQVFETPAGMRIRGFGSAGFSQKSLNIYFRKGYGLNKIEAPLFSNSSVENYKRLVLRNGGNDFPHAHFKDAYLSRVIRSFKVEVQEYDPVILFVNGEYWGMHNMREKHDKHHFRYKYDLPQDEINVVGPCGELRDGSNEDYFELIDYIEAHDLSDDQAYAQVKQMLDIESTIDYNIAEIYFANYDWPANNFKMWKTNTPGDKWKYVIHDLDYTLGYSEYAAYTVNSLEHAVTATNDWPTSACASVILRNLLKNESFVNQFLERFKYYLENEFSRNNMNQLLDEFVEVYSYGISEHIARFNFPASVTEWHENIDVFREFIDQRPCYMKEHLMEFFDLDTFAFNCEGVVGVQQIADAADAWLVFPNPNSGVFYIQNQSHSSYNRVSIEIFNTIGRRVYSKMNIEIGRNAMYRLQTENLASGIYMLRIRDDAGEQVLKMFMQGNGLY